jgi:hypothetical protein
MPGQEVSLSHTDSGTSTVRVKDVPRSPWRKEIGKLFRIGYYSKMDGLDCIGLVDARGEYCQTLDRDFLDKFLDILTSLLLLQMPRGAAKSETKANKSRPFGLP